MRKEGGRWCTVVVCRGEVQYFVNPTQSIPVDIYLPYNYLGTVPVRYSRIQRGDLGEACGGRRSLRLPVPALCEAHLSLYNCIYGAEILLIGESTPFCYIFATRPLPDLKFPFAHYLRIDLKLPTIPGT